MTATTPSLEQALKTILDWDDEYFGNPHSTKKMGAFENAAVIIARHLASPKAEPDGLTGEQVKMILEVSARLGSLGLKDLNLKFREAFLDQIGISAC